jgi:tetratricopeptide (TPR) repeat protein
VALSRSRRLRPAAFGLVWFSLALLPTSSIFPLSEVYNEHRIFFPYVGLTIAVVWTAWIAFRGLHPPESARPLHRVVIPAVVALAVLGGHAVATHQRNEVWRDDLSLWGDVARKSPENGRGLMNYGLALMSRGRLDEAHELFLRAKVFTPNYSILEVNLGIVTAALGDDEQAETHFRRALQLDPQYGRAYHYYANWLLKQGRALEAIQNLERAVAITPWSLDSRILLMRLYAVADQRAKLDRLVASTLDLAPDDPTALAFSRRELPVDAGDRTAEGYSTLGRTRLEQKMWVDSVLLNRKALELDPNSAIAWNNLGWGLGNLGLYRRAIPCFEKAYELDPEMTVARGNLEWARRGAANQGTRR